MGKRGPKPKGRIKVLVSLEPAQVEALRHLAQRRRMGIDSFVPAPNPDVSGVLRDAIDFALHAAQSRELIAAMARLPANGTSTRSLWAWAVELAAGKTDTYSGPGEALAGAYRAMKETGLLDAIEAVIPPDAQALAYARSADELLQMRLVQAMVALRPVSGPLPSKDALYRKTLALFGAATESQARGGLSGAEAMKLAAEYERRLSGPEAAALAAELRRAVDSPDAPPPSKHRSHRKKGGAK